MTEPESLILKLLQQMREEISTKADLARLDRKIDSVAESLRGEMTSLRRDLASDLLVMQATFTEEQRQTRDQVVGLRRAVVEYHTSVIGHGIMISDLEARMRRVEQTLNLPPIDAH
jgi:chromosome segregation ATPase